MNKAQTIKSKIDELSRDLCQLIGEVPSYYTQSYTQRLNEISKVCGLYNKVASLSNYQVADALMYTVKHIAYCSSKSNHEVICEYLNRAIKDLESGMSASDMLDEYEEIYEVYYKMR